MQALILAAGRGTRMKSDLSKVLHPILGVPILECVFNALAGSGVKKTFVVIGHGGDQVQEAFKDRAHFVWQKEQRGTGHAVLCAEKVLDKNDSSLLILPGDMPLLRPKVLRLFLAEHQKSKATASVLTCLRRKPHGYGRILRRNGKFFAIREELDASQDEKAINEVNAGVYAFNARKLFQALQVVRPENAKKEIYLTDTLEIFSRQGDLIEAFPLASEDDGQGINSRSDLSIATRVMNQRHIQQYMEEGVTIMAPDQTFIASGVKIGRDTTIFPWSYIEKNVRIGAHCQIGPFAKVREGSVIGDKSVIGSFVEVNRSVLGKSVMAKHLAYLGDAKVGDETNIGAGTITANFDGKSKHQTIVGKKVLLGSNTVLIAPVNIADGAKTGAGSVVTAGSKIKKSETVAGVPARPLTKKKKK